MKFTRVGTCYFFRGVLDRFFQEMAFLAACLLEGPGHGYRATK